MSDLEDAERDSRRAQRVTKKKLNDIKLIRLVRTHRSLYEADDADYHNQLRREEIWQEIARQMGRNMDDCKRRWYNIRDCFRKSLLKRQMKNFDGEFCTKPIRFEKEITFMIPHLKNAKRSKRTPSEDEADHDPLTSISQDMEYDVEAELSPEVVHTLADEDPVQEADVQAATEIHEILQELVSWRRQEQRTKRDHIGTYFQSIEETVRTLPWALQIEAKKQISSLVFDLELKASGDGQPRYDVPESSSNMKTD